MSAFSLILKKYGIKPVPEYQFHPGRKWRFDFAFPDIKVALEVEGGLFKKTTYRNKAGILVTNIGGRHTTGKGYLADIEKYNTATMFGWRVFRVTPDKLLSDGVELILKCYNVNYHIGNTVTQKSNRIKP